MANLDRHARARPAHGIVRAGFSGLLPLVLAGANAASAAAQTLARDHHTVVMAGRTLQCGGVRTVLNKRLPMEGMAVEGESVVLNPILLARLPETVRVFIFYHECAHQTVGGDEMAADCTAVKRGVGEGWLDEAGLKAVCQSFVHEPPSDTHPSGPVRCRALDRCFAAARARQQVATAAAPVPPLPVRAPPRLTSGPQLAVKPAASEDRTFGLRTPREPAPRAVNP